MFPADGQNEDDLTACDEGETENKASVSNVNAASLISAVVLHRS